MQNLVTKMDNGNGADARYLDKRLFELLDKRSSQIADSVAKGDGDLLYERHKGSIMAFGNMMMGLAQVSVLYNSYTSWAIQQQIQGYSGYERDVRDAEIGQSNRGGGTGKTPHDFLDEALSQQGLKSAPDRLKQSWTENGYEYEVRIHPAEPQYGQQGSIYRVARRLQGTDAYGQGSGWEYMDIYGNWHHTSTLKPSNPAFNSQAATDTHIPLK